MARQFGRNIRIIGNSLGQLRVTYESQVNECLLSLMMFRTGKAVIEHIWRAHRNIRIVPWHSTQENAEADADDDNAATVRGEPVRDGTGRHHASWGVGTGRGSGSIVRFTPWIFPTETLPRFDPIAMHNWEAVLGWQPAAAGREADEVLLHELFHALESLYGRASGARLAHGFDTVAEFHAILVVNLMARERLRPARMNHQGHQTAASPIDLIHNEDEFWNRVEVFRGRHRDLAAELAAVPVEGNPFGGRPTFREPWPPVLR